MPKVLITGSLGLTGSEAVDFFKEKGWEVIGIDNNMRAKLFSVPESKVENYLGLLDIRDEKAIDALFSLNKFDAIIHTAAQPSHDYSKDHVLEDFDINARGTVILLEAARKYCPDAVFIFCSTDKVYGGNMESSYMNTLKRYVPRRALKKGFDEELSIDQSIHSPFGCGKAAADLYVQEYGYYFNMYTACFRLGCITGSRHKGAELHGFLAYLAKCIKEGIPYKIFGYEGKQVRDQIHSYDLVNAFWHFIQNPKVAAVYNMGGGVERSVSILEAIEMIERETGKKAIIEYHEPRKGDRNWDIHDVSKFKKDYPEWNYKYSLEDIIKDLCRTS
jgi:CDP-paratose 2-epimerase